jgi:hypothetical protein
MEAGSSDKKRNRQMSISFISPDLQHQHSVLEGRARRLRGRVVKHLVDADGKRGKRRPNGLTVADRLLRYADELAASNWSLPI